MIAYNSLVRLKAYIKY